MKITLLSAEGQIEISNEGFEGYDWAAVTAFDLKRHSSREREKHLTELEK